tara:strand:- start:132 stop:482 length:351 start_codon:yes stop_codon:yes gene_type:complete
MSKFNYTLIFIISILGLITSKQILSGQGNHFTLPNGDRVTEEEAYRYCLSEQVGHTADDNNYLSAYELEITCKYVINYYISHGEWPNKSIPTFTVIPCEELKSWLGGAWDIKCYGN